jgi:ATP-dependent DNA helicase RecQ
MDKFIKIILRAFAGVFSQYVNIDEAYVARVSGIPLPMAVENLKRLSKQKIINYIPRKKTPLIIFTAERLDDKNLLLSHENYRLRKERFLKRIDALLDYASNSTKCRSQFLLDYFGDTDSYRCGKCDICTSRNELDLSKIEFDKTLDRVKEILTKEPTTIETLVDSINEKPDRTLKVVHFLLDNKKIVKNDSGLLRWWSNAE